MFLAAAAAALAGTSTAAAPQPAIYKTHDGVAGAYRYSQQWVTGAATVELDSSRLGWAAGHASVWVGADDRAGRWIQAGVTMNRGWSSPCAYVEVGRGHESTVTCVRSVALGEPVRVRISFSSRHGEVAWVDGAPAGSATLGAGLEYFSSAELYGSGSSAWRIDGHRGALGR